MRLFELDDSERGHVTQSFEEPNIDAGARKLHEWLLSRGFEEGGAGGYAVVYFHPNRPYMIKVAKQPDKIISPMQILQGIIIKPTHYYLLCMTSGARMITSWW